MRVYRFDPAKRPDPFLQDSPEVRVPHCKRCGDCLGESVSFKTKHCNDCRRILENARKLRKRHKARLQALGCGLSRA